VREAMKFGHYSLINRVAEKLKGVVNAKCDDKDADLQVAIAQAKRQMIREKASIVAEK
jgi:hypothetical protein